MDNEFGINTFIDSFLNYHHEINNLLFDNIGIYYHLAIFVNKQTQVEEQTEQIDWTKVTRKTFLENLALIDSFYKNMEINFNIDDIIKDGTIDIVTNDLDETIHYNTNKLISGYNGYINEHKSIDINNNGLITDGIVWVHEISHHRNQPNKDRNQVNYLLTEALAHANELIYADYLNKKGYAYESYHLKKILLDSFHFISYRSYILTKMYLLYQELGDTSKESYKYYYGYDDDYEEIKDKFIKTIEKDQDAIFNSIWYTLSGVFSIYMYEEYKKDNRFINNLEDLNDSLLNENNLKKCLRIIGITGYNKESIGKIEEAYDEYKKELKITSKKLIKK